MTDYQSVVEQMLAHLKHDEEQHRRGEMMSMAEAVHGEIKAREYRNLLEHLIKVNVLEAGA